LDPEADDLPVARYIENRELDNDTLPPPPECVAFCRRLNVASSGTLPNRPPDPESVIGSHASGQNLAEVIESSIDIRRLCDENYASDSVLRHVIDSPDRRDHFRVRDRIIQMRNQLGRWVSCIPSKATIGGRRLAELLINQAHSILGHLGRAKTHAYLSNFYWWPSMASEVDRFCSSCTDCQRSKPTNKPPVGLLKSLPVPSYPWESVGIDFVGPITESEDGLNFMMVVIDRLTSMVHIVPMKSTATAADVAWHYLDKVAKLHGFPKSIVSHRDTRCDRQSHYCPGKQGIVRWSI
jgi:hypothetical protein